MKLICDMGTFRPADTSKVRWLDWEADFTLAQQFWPPGVPLSKQDWQQARKDGYRYGAILEEGRIAAIAAERRFSEHAWMVAAVRTAPRLRRRGYGKSVVSFITAHILAAGRTATCGTRDDNVAMISTAESVGFKSSEQGAALGSHSAGAP